MSVNFSRFIKYQVDKQDNVPVLVLPCNKSSCVLVRFKQLLVYNSIYLSELPLRNPAVALVFFFFNGLLILFCLRYRLSKYSMYNILENTLCLVENLWGLFCSVQSSMTH